MKYYKQSRTFMPEILAPGTGLSPITDKSVVPTNNVHTIQDVLDGRKYTLPGGGGEWSSGEDVSKSYKEEGDAYKRQVRDIEIFNNITDPSHMLPAEKWKVKIPGGSKVFPSFDLAQEFRSKMTGKGVPIKWIARIAQSNPDRVQVVSGSLKKTFKVEAIDVYNSSKETGAAFCIAPNYFATCAHVIVNYDKSIEPLIDVDDYSDRIEIFMIQSGRKFKAQVAAFSGDWDIAILKCNIDVEPFRLDIGSMQIGDDILAIGSPHGFENNVSFGNIGSIGKQIYSYKGAPKYFFIDAPVFPGNSGGPIIKIENGEVIGILTAIVAKNGEYGLNVGLPSSYLRNFCIMNNISTE